MDGDGLERLALHVDVPDLEVQVVARQDVSAVMAELHVRNRRDNFREERPIRRILLFLEH